VIKERANRKSDSEKALLMPKIPIDGRALERSRIYRGYAGKPAILPRPPFDRSLKVSRLFASHFSENEIEGRYFMVFQDRTSFRIAPYFHSETWRRLILQSGHVPAVRHAIIAIGALDIVSTVAQDGREMSLDFLGNPNLTRHHKFAIEQ